MAPVEVWSAPDIRAYEPQPLIARQLRQNLAARAQVQGALAMSGAARFGDGAFEIAAEPPAGCPASQGAGGTNCAAPAKIWPRWLPTQWL